MLSRAETIILVIFPSEESGLGHGKRRAGKCNGRTRWTDEAKRSVRERPRLRPGRGRVRRPVEYRRVVFAGRLFVNQGHPEVKPGSEAWVIASRAGAVSLCGPGRPRMETACNPWGPVCGRYR